MARTRAQAKDKQKKILNQSCYCGSVKCTMLIAISGPLPKCCFRTCAKVMYNTCVKVLIVTICFSFSTSCCPLQYRNTASTSKTRRCSSNMARIHICARTGLCHTISILHAKRTFYNVLPVLSCALGLVYI